MEEALPTILNVTENLLLEIEKTFDFFKATAASDRIDQLFVSGGAAGVEGFVDALEARFDLPISHFDPFRQIAFDTKQFSQELRQELVATSAVAVGLALREEDDR
jgi:type IV pilus assembly protein PilM